MMKIAIAAALIVVGTLSLTVGAKAETQPTARHGTVVAGKSDRIAASQGQAAVREDVARDWAVTCHAEFGPDAKIPDPALLEKCLK